MAKRVELGPYEVELAARIVQITGELADKESALIEMLAMAFCAKYDVDPGQAVLVVQNALGERRYWIESKIAGPTADLLKATEMLLATSADSAWLHMENDDDCACKSCAKKFARGVVARVKEEVAE